MSLRGAWQPRSNFPLHVAASGFPRHRRPGRLRSSSGNGVLRRKERSSQRHGLEILCLLANNTASIS